MPIDDPATTRSIARRFRDAARVAVRHRAREVSRCGTAVAALTVFRGAC